MEKIVVGVDGSEHSKAALEWAIAEAKVRGASLEVVMVWHEPYYGGSVTIPIPVTFDDLEVSFRAQLDALIESVDTSGLPEPLTATLVRGGSSGELLAAADKADLLVVGRRGHGGFIGLLLGSVTSQLAAHAPCPVVIVPAEGAS